MTDLNISRAFTLTLADGSRYALLPGLNREVPAEVISHPFLQYLKVPEDAKDEMRQPVPDARGVGELVQARAIAEDAAERLRAEVARLTLAWSESEIRARRAEMYVDDLKSQLTQASVGSGVAQEVFDDMQRQRDEAHARVAELEGGVSAAQERVEDLASDFKAQPSPVPATPPVESPSSPPVDAAPPPDHPYPGAAEPTSDETIGDYTVRRRGKKYVVIKLDSEGNTVETVESFDSKSEAETKAESLKAAL